jgi:hypothetical protein
MNFITALILAGSLWAVDNQKKIEVVDPTWGAFTIKLEKTDGPVQNRIQLDVSVVCKDQRKSPTSVTPKEEELLDHDHICSFDRYNFDKEQKVMTLAFTVSKTVDDEAKCIDRMVQTFDLKKVCEAWTSVAK